MSQNEKFQNWLFSAVFQSRAVKPGERSPKAIMRVKDFFPIKEPNWVNEDHTKQILGSGIRYVYIMELIEEPMHFCDVGKDGPKGEYYCNYSVTIPETYYCRARDKLTHPEENPIVKLIEVVLTKPGTAALPAWPEEDRIAVQPLFLVEEQKEHDEGIKPQYELDLLEEKLIPKLNWDDLEERAKDMGVTEIHLKTLDELNTTGCVAEFQLGRLYLLE